MSPARIRNLPRDRIDEKVRIDEKQVYMTSNTNAQRKMLKFDLCDDVYITDESAATAKKIRNHFKGPFVVHVVLSLHMLCFRDSSTDKVMTKPVNIDGLIMGYGRHAKLDNLLPGKD